MPPSTLMSQPRVARCAMFVLAGATALSVAACGSPTDNSSKSSAPSTSEAAGAPGKHGGKDRVHGLIASVSGNTVQVTEKSGNVSVSFSDTTKVTEMTAAQLSDVTAGSCIMVKPAEGGTTTGVTAKAVLVGPAVNGKCGEEKKPAGAESEAPSETPSEAPKDEHHGVRGVVGSVNGDTIVVNSTDASGTSAPTNVTVTGDTKYMKRQDAQSSAIVAGKCLMARGEKDSSGTLQATNIMLRPSENGACGGHEHGDHEHDGGDHQH